jgi:phosphatidate cytidylyltransferase
MVPILLLVYYLGREAAIVFLTLVAIVGFHEFARATGLGDDRVISAAVYVGIGATGATSLMPDPSGGPPGWFGLFMTLPVFVVAVIVAIPVAGNRACGQLRLIALAVLAYVYLGWMFGHLAFLANTSHAYSYLGYLVLAVELNDVAAYTFGTVFGRHILRSGISPKKTCEGALGALAVSLLLPWALHFTFPHFEARDCIAAGLMVGIGGQIGDLVMSVVKRDRAIKDMGATIPGHGGILDRIDSLIYVAPLFFHYVRVRFGVNPSA